MKRILSLTLVATLLSFAASAAQEHIPLGANIAVLDGNEIMKESLAAKNIIEQIEKKRAEYQADITKNEMELKKKKEDLMKQESILSKDALEQKAREFESKVADLQRSVQNKRSQIDNAYSSAIVVIDNSVNDILSKMAAEKKFDVVLSSVQVLYFTPKLDITKEVIKKLNDRVKKVPVKFESVEKK